MRIYFTELLKLRTCLFLLALVFASAGGLYPQSQPGGSQAGELHGISDIWSGRLFVVKPHGLVGFTHRPDSDLCVIYTAGTRFASLVAANPPRYYENRFGIKFTYSWLL
jgi:hypothetical protein